MACRINLTLPFCISLIVAYLTGIHNAQAPVFRSRSLIINSTEDSTLSCYHPDAGNIDWSIELMNGTVVNRRNNTLRNIIYHNCRHSASDPLRYTVTIPSKSEYYNGARIVCHAFSDDSLESLPILTLTTTSRRTMNVSVGEIASFQCASCSRIDWLVNKTHLNRLLGTGYYRDINVTTSLAPDGSTRISTLHIIGQLVYNNTLIECRAEGAPEHLPAVSLFVYQRQCQKNLTLDSYLILNSNEQVEVLLTTHNIMNLDSSYRVYNKSIIQLDSLDGLNSSHLEVVPSYHDQTLALNLTLPRGRIWNVTVIAYCEFAAFELSTHDIQNISVRSHSPGQVTIALDFLQGSTATDILTILYRSSDSYDIVLYDLAPRIPNTRNAVVNVTGVDSGAYDVFVYAVRGNGTYSLATVEPKSIIVDSSNEPPPSELPPPKIEYDIQMTSNGFKVTCNFLDSSISQCVVVVHQKFPVPDNHLNVTLYVHQLGSVGNVVSGYIYVANPDDFQIAVIDGTRKPTKPTKPTTNTLRWIAFVALPCLLCVCLVVGFIVRHVHKKKMERQAIPEDRSPPSLPVAPEGGFPPSLPAVPNGSSQPPQHEEIDRTEESPHDVSPEGNDSEGQTPFQTTTPEQEVSNTVNHRKGGLMPRFSVNRPGPVEENDSGDDSRLNTFLAHEQPHQEQMDMVGSNSTLVELRTCNTPPECQGEDIHHENMM